MAHLVMFFYIGPEPVDAMVAVCWGFQPGQRERIAETEGMVSPTT